MTEEPSPTVAIIVVPGVGDHPAGEAVDQLATALTRVSDSYAWAAAPGERSIDVPPGGARSGERYDARTRRLTRDDGTVVDLIEMRWSDLSSFPGSSLTSFFASAFGLGVQLTTVGLEATPPRATRSLRGLWLAYWVLLAAGAGVLAAVGVTRGLEPWWVGAAVAAAAAGLVTLLAVAVPSLDAFTNRAMATLSAWIATIVIPLTVVAALVGTALWLVVDQPLGLADPVALLLVLAAGIGAMAALGRGLRDGGWVLNPGPEYGWARRVVTPTVVTGIMLVAAVLLVGWRIRATGSIEAGLGQSVAVISGYAIRPAWLGALLLVGATGVLIGVLLLREGAGAVRAAFTRVATVIAGPLLVAVVGTVLVGGIGAFAFTSAADEAWGPDIADLRCFPGPGDWVWSSTCGMPADEWQRLVGAVTTLDAQADAASATAEGARRDVVAEGGPADAAVGPQALSSALRDEAGALERANDVNPTAWATQMFGVAMLPLVPLVLLVLVAAVLCANLLVARGRAGESPGGRLSDALAIFAGRAAVALLVLGGVVAAATGAAIWIAGVWDPGSVAQAGAWTASALLVLTLVGRVAPIDPRRWRARVDGGLASARVGLDIPYDVATYLRIDHDGDGVRSRIVARYRALLGAIQDEYSHVVVAAHSQGSMYTLATLAGDHARRNPEDPGDPGGEPWGVAPWHVLHPASPLRDRGVSLLTFGCPVLQTYEERLPGQFAWTRLAGGELGARLAMVSRVWVNAYRPRDYIGRSVFRRGGATMTVPRTYLHDTVPVAGRPAPIGVIDACIPGTGSHTGYFSDPALARWLDVVLRRTLDPVGPWRPPGYALGTAPAE